MRNKNNRPQKNEVKKVGIPLINFSFIKRMLNQIDVDEKSLDIKSTDKVEAELAKSESGRVKEIADSFNGGTSKAQRRATLNQIHVPQENLKKAEAKNRISEENTQNKSESSRTNEDDGRGWE